MAETYNFMKESGFKI